MLSLGRLEKVDLRTVWTGEASDFTPWLAQESNLKLLSETIGVELEFSSIEKDVGLFRADILCKNTLDSSWVLIENQLERTDHNHLGQLLTYAAGLEAVTIIWIASRFTEEHRAALDWLNQITDDRFNFFGLEVELWRIGDSFIAPKFNIISKPNEWTRTVQESARASTSAQVSDFKQKQLQYWQSFSNYMDVAKSFVRCQKPLPQHWMNHAIGKSGFKLSSVISSYSYETKEPEMRAEFVIDGKNSKESFLLLENQKEEIESEFGKPLVWYSAPNVKSCRIYTQSATNFLDEQKWNEQHEWLRLNLEKIHQVFVNRVKNL